ncbi:MAG: aminoacyl-tRNA hydrolase [Pseudomonadota bacterium]
MASIAVIAGLGNPGSAYAHTRHNVGTWWVESLAERYRIPLKLETRFKAQIGRGWIAGTQVRLLVPTTFMNDSGEAVAALCRFYKIEPAQLLVAYDEMAFEPGQVRLRTGGSDNGHNGIRSIVSCLGNQKGFHRLRIGVGHPGHKSKVTAYLTSQRPPAEQRAAIEDAIDLPESVLRDLLAGEHQAAMNALHAPRNEGRD